jgi:ubiquinone biosynthesis protein UbiJ
MAPVIAVINHLLAQQPWASRQLALHAGKVACIDVGAFALLLRVGADGMVEAAPLDAAANVTIRLKLLDLPLIAQNRARAFSYVNIDGDAEFANAISQLSKSLRWDAEHDLESIVGQIAARRIVAGGKAGAQAVVLGQQRLLENVAEFLQEEQPLLVRPGLVEGFGLDVTRLRDDVERAAKRMEKLEKALEQALARNAARQIPLDKT